MTCGVLVLAIIITEMLFGRADTKAKEAPSNRKTLSRANYQLFKYHADEVASTAAKSKSEVVGFALVHYWINDDNLRQRKLGEGNTLGGVGLPHHVSDPRPYQYSGE